MSGDMNVDARTADKTKGIFKNLIEKQPSFEKGHEKYNQEYNKMISIIS